MRNKIIQDLKPFGAKLVAVSKTQTVDRIKELYDAGQRVFGENRVQELLDKKDLLPPDLQWHLIGHLQRNKVKFIAPFIAMVHSVDSIDLAVEIDRQAAKFDRSITVLLQFRIAAEETKFGIKYTDLEVFMDDLLGSNFKHIVVAGVMGMASFVDDQAQVRTEFKQLNRIFKQLKEQYYADDPHFSEKSMGMSGDYLIALEEGSTMVRVGSLLFGERKK